MAPAALIVFFALYFNISLAVYKDTKCEINEKYASSRSETKCSGKGSCRGCKMTLTDSTLLNCGDAGACADIMASIVAKKDFLLECNGTNGCRDGFIEIDCRGREIKGIKCGDKYSC